jgi:hypothetical protein
MALLLSLLVLFVAGTSTLGALMRREVGAKRLHLQAVSWYLDRTHIVARCGLWKFDLEEIAAYGGSVECHGKIVGLIRWASW